MSGLTESKALYWLSSSGLSVKKQNKLLEIYSILEIWDTILKNRKFKEFCGDAVHDKLVANRSIDFLDNRLESLYSKDIKIISRADADFSECLGQKEVSPPTILYYRGDISLLKTKCIGVVGTRKSSFYGKEATIKLTQGLVAAGITVVSGLATGIDTYAHIAAIDNGGKTIAVLGSGHNKIYPAINAPLAKRMESGGHLVLSEYPPDFTATQYTFPERNRIVSGLTLGIVIVEADEKSGAIITADFALEQGRETFAVPGNITSAKSKGTNFLIKAGRAKFVTCAEDILDELRISHAVCDKAKVQVMNIFEHKIFSILECGEKHFDELIISSGMDYGELMSILTTMELNGIIKKLPSNFYRLA